MSDFVLVPRVPTLAMTEAGIAAIKAAPDLVGIVDQFLPEAWDCFVAMIAAAPPPSAETVWRLLVPKVDRFAAGDERYMQLSQDWHAVPASWVGEPVRMVPVRRRYTPPAADPAQGPRSTLRDEAMSEIEEFQGTWRLWKRNSTQEWVLELDGTINETSFVSRHVEPLTTAPEDVPGLPSLYAPASEGGEQGWISVLDRLPVDGESTYCWEPRKGNQFVSQFLEKMPGGKPGWSEEYYEKSPTTDGCRGGMGHWPFVTHWRPLFNAPTVEYWGGGTPAKAEPRVTLATPPAEKAPAALQAITDFAKGMEPMGGLPENFHDYLD